MNLEGTHTIYMLGIGGIGMSALARYFKQQGITVSGYDRTQSTLTTQLIREGIPVHFEEDVTQIPSDALYIYTPAVPKDHKAFGFVTDKGGKWFKRSEVLEKITQSIKTIAIAGTHGKTTTTAITAHLLHTTMANCCAFVGGIMTGYESNLITMKSPEYIIVEADEYDRSFLRLHPNIAVITSLDPDHLDIYGTHEEMLADYQRFAQRAELLIIHEDVAAHIAHANKRVYGASSSSDYHFKNVRPNDGAFEFDFGQYTGLRLQLPGKHNVENASAALAVVSEIGVRPDLFSEAIHSFKGVKRRFELAYSDKDKVLIDDYAHHPEEIKAVIQAARELYPGRGVAVVFQPHLYTRTRDLEDSFAIELSQADQVILIPIYPARERPIDGVSSAHLLKKVKLKTKVLVQKSDLVNAVLSLTAEIVLILGAGDIDRLVQPITEAFEKRQHVE